MNPVHDLFRAAGGARGDEVVAEAFERDGLLDQAVDVTRDFGRSVAEIGAAVEPTVFYRDEFLRHDAADAVVNEGHAELDGFAGSAGAGAGNDDGGQARQREHAVGVSEGADF